MIGNNNADGKAKCGCGRNITIHLRRHKEKVTKKWCDKPDCKICNPKPPTKFTPMPGLATIRFNCPRCHHQWHNQHYGGNCPTCGCNNKGEGGDRMYINSSDPKIKLYIADNNPDYQLLEKD